MIVTYVLNNCAVAVVDTFIGKSWFFDPMRIHAWYQTWNLLAFSVYLSDNLLRNHGCWVFYTSMIPSCESDESGSFTCPPCPLASCLVPICLISSHTLQFPVPSCTYALLLPWPTLSCATVPSNFPCPRAPGSVFVPCPNVIKPCVMLMCCIIVQKATIL